MAVLESYVITLREGMEAFLIVAITTAYLRKTGRGHLLRAVGWGVAASVLVSIGAGLLLERAMNQPLWEGVWAIGAAVLVGTMTVQLLLTAKAMKRNLEARLEATTRKAGVAAFAGLFLFTVLMITREGMETAMLLGSLLSQEGSGSVLAGALLGLASAAGLAWMWSRYGHRVNLARFFQVTAVFLFVFLVQLLIYGFHEITEAGVIPIERSLNDRLHWATEPYGPEGRYGQWLTFAMVALPVLWLVWTALRDRIFTKRLLAEQSS